MGSCTNHFNPSSSGSAGPSSFSPTSSLEPEPLLCLPRLTPPRPRGLLRSPSRCVPRGMLAGPFPGGGSLWLVPGPLATSPSGQELGCGQLCVPHKAFAEDLLCARPGDSHSRCPHPAWSLPSSRPIQPMPFAATCPCGWQWAPSAQQVTNPVLEIHLYNLAVSGNSTFPFHSFPWAKSLGIFFDSSRPLALLSLPFSLPPPPSP